jgi:hypothetical protein
MPSQLSPHRRSFVGRRAVTSKSLVAAFSLLATAIIGIGSTSSASAAPACTCTMQSGQVEHLHCLQPRPVEL